MTDKKDDAPRAGETLPPPPSSASASSTPKVSEIKRPHATIDLKASEVKPSPADAAKLKEAEAARLRESEAAKHKESEAAKAAAKVAETKAAADAKAKAATAAAASPRRSGGGVASTFTHLLAGVIGGGMVWYGVTALGPQYGLVPVVSDPRTAPLEAKLAALQQTVSSRALGTVDTTPAVTALQSQVAKLEKANKSFDDLAAAQAKIATDTKALSDKLAKSPDDQAAARIAKLEERLKLMSDAAGNDSQPGKLPQIAALSGRLVDLEATLTNQLSALRKTVSQELEQRLSLTNETSEAAKSGTNRIDRDLASVKSQAASVDQKLATLRGDTDRVTSAIAAVRDDTSALKTAFETSRSEWDARFKAAVKPADVASAIAPVAGKVASLEQSVTAVTRSEDERRGNAERILLSLELSNLKRVIDRGQKYASELDSVKKAAASTKVDLTVLERYKDTGIPTLGDLTREFGPVSNAMLESQADTGDGSVVGRMLASARSVISVRKISYDTNDKSPEAVVGRMDQALRDGNIQGVLDQAKSIPPKATGAAQDWLVRLEARAAVDRAIASLEGALKTAVTGPTAAASPPK